LNHTRILSSPLLPNHFRSGNRFAKVCAAYFSCLIASRNRASMAASRSGAVTLRPSSSHT